MADLSVRVLNDDGEPLEGIPVRLGFKGLTRGMSDTEDTDSEGYAYFRGYDEGPIKVYVNHKNYGDYDYRDGDSIDITR